MAGFLAYVPPPQVVVITYDIGGVVSEYEEMVARYAKEGRRVEIKGTCASACTLALTLPNTCVHKEATVAWHQAYYAETHRIIPDLTQRMLVGLPEKLQEYLKDRIKAEYTPETILHYETLKSLGVKGCDETPPPAAYTVKANVSVTTENDEPEFPKTIVRPEKSAADKDAEWRAYTAWATKQSMRQYEGGNFKRACFSNGQCAFTIYYWDGAGMFTHASEYKKNGKVVDRLVCRSQNEYSPTFVCKVWEDGSDVQYVRNRNGEYVEARN